MTMSSGTPLDDFSPGSEFVVGRHPVLEAIQTPSVPIERILLQQALQGRWVESLKRAARAARLPVHTVPKARLDRLVGGGTHQGVAAILAASPYLQLEEMLHAIARDPDTVRARKPVLVVLDHLEDPRNFGAILRSALGSGVSGVIVPDRGMAPLGPAAVKASAGAALKLPIARTGSLSQAVDQLKERGYWVVGAEGHAELTLWQYDWDRPIAVVLGSESSGIRPALRAKCDALVSIPLVGAVESLNVSVAGALILFEILRLRGVS